MKNTKIAKATNHDVAIGLGITAIAATAAGAYYLYGSMKGPARRKALKGWTLRMKGEVMDEMEKMKDLSEEAYHSVIDKVSKKYKAMKNIDPAELSATVKRLKGHWKDIKKEVGVLTNIS